MKKSYHLPSVSFNYLLALKLRDHSIGNAQNCGMHDFKVILFKKTSFHETQLLLICIIYNWNNFLRAADFEYSVLSAM